MNTERNEENEIDDAELDEMLRGHFADELDGHVGRARAAFERHVAETTRTIHVVSPGRARWRHRIWGIGAAGVGLAASLAAAVLVVPALLAPHRAITENHLSQPVDSYVSHVEPVAPTAADATTSAAATTAAAVHPAFQFQEVDHSLSSYTQDQGLYLIGDGDRRTPARVVRELSVERTRWIDQDSGVKIEAVVPRVDVKFIQVETH